MGGLQRVVDRMSKTTFSGDPLVRLKQFVEAAEKDAKSTGKDKKSKRSNEKSESSSGGSGGSRGANAVGKTAAGKDEQDDWKPVGKAGKFDTRTRTVLHRENIAVPMGKSRQCQRTGLARPASSLPIMRQI